VRLWIDILACAQHPIERGDMSEIGRLPEVISFVGKTLAMPVVGSFSSCVFAWSLISAGVFALSCLQGTVKRIWCLFEFAWSINLNGGGCLFYAGFDDAAAAELDETTRSQLRELVQEDKLRLQTSDPTSLLHEANTCETPNNLVKILMYFLIDFLLKVKA
jgi:hypothetical protein